MPFSWQYAIHKTLRVKNEEKKKMKKYLQGKVDNVLDV